MLKKRFTIKPFNVTLDVTLDVILGSLALLFLLLYLNSQPAKSTPQVGQVGEDVYWLCTDLPEFIVPGTTVSVHTPKDGETMNAACRDMDKDFFQIVEGVAGGWVRDGDPQEKKTLGFMRWLDMDLSRDLSYRIKSTAFMPNLVMVTIVATNQEPGAVE